MKRFRSLAIGAVLLLALASTAPADISLVQSILTAPSDAAPAAGELLPIESGAQLKSVSVYALLHAGVASFEGRIGDVVLTASDVESGLGYTPLKPSNNLSDVANAATALANLGGAPLASPALTGTPTAPTPSTADNSTKIATTAYVQAQGYGTGNGNVTGGIASVVGNVVTESGTDGKHIQDSGTALSAVAPLASPAFTGTPTTPTPTTGDSSTKIATTAFVQAAVTSGAKLVPVRQTVIAGASTSGVPSFLAAGSGLAVNLLATATPVEIAFANGFGAGGAKDDVYQFTADQTSFWSGLTDNATNYLYINWNSGSPTGGSTTLAPAYGPTAPGTPSTGQDWFNTISYQMEDWNGSAWVAVERVYVGQATTDFGQLIAHTSLVGSGPSTAINTTGANLIIVGVTDVGTNPSSISDSAGNTWTLAKAQVGTGTGVAVYYSYNPTTSPSHTFSETGASDPVIFVIAFSNAASAPLDQTNSATSSALTIQPGSVTASQNNEIIAALASNGGGSGQTLNSIDSSFTISDRVAGGGANVPAGMAYLFQGTAAAVNPTFTFSQNTGNAAAIMTFKANGGAVRTLTTYAYQGQYVGPWTATLPSSGTLVSANDNIGTNLKTCTFEIENLTANLGYSPGDIVQNPNTASGIGTTLIIGTNTVAVMSGGWWINNKGNATAAAPTAADWEYQPLCQRAFR